MAAGHEKTVAVLEAYFDESGIQDERFCVVAGFVATSQKWSIFEEGWQRATAGVEFHAKRFFARDDKGQRVGDYAGWSDRQAKAYLDRCLDAVLTRAANNVLIPVGAVVDVAAFKALPLRERKWLTGYYLDSRRKAITTGAPSQPYFVALPWCLSQAADCVRKPGTKVEIVCDRSPNVMGLVTNVFDVVTQRSPFGKLLGELAFKQAQDVGGLQAADLLTYCCYQKAIGDYTRKPELAHAITRAGTVLVRRHRMALLDADGLSAVLEDTDARQALAMIK